MPTSIKDKIHAVMFAMLNNQGIEEPHKERVRKTAQISAGSFPSVLSRIVKKDGTIAYGTASSTIKLTAKGKDFAAGLAPPEDLPTTNAQVQEKLKQDLKGMALKIFEFLQDGEEKEKIDVMSAVGCTNKNSFAPIMSRDLKSKGLVEYPSRTTVKLSMEMCFPFDK